MERVAFILEETGERLACLLNPETFVVKRTAGVRRRRGGHGLMTSAGATDDPLLYTGGGTTQLELKLLFDISLAGSTIESDDVRELTRPLWNLAENAGELSSYGRPPLVRFMWGKGWNYPAIVTAVAERLEYFSPLGVARRSWLAMRLTRVNEPDLEQSDTMGPTASMDYLDSQALDLGEGDVRLYEVPGAGPIEGEQRPCGERLDTIAARFYGSAAYWRLLAFLNRIDDPACVEPGTVLRIPSLSALRGREGRA